MKFLPIHIDALRSFGYTEEEARFLYLVATHSGYFTASSSCISSRRSRASAAWRSHER